MHALDSFISLVLDFYGDITFLTIPVSARPLGDESIGDPLARANASASKT
jgi:hypothetical protein